jgi:predicted GTPase
MGAGGREFHDFSVVFRDDPRTRVVAFTAAQIPGIADRRYPPSLAGPSYPEGIPVHPESELEALVAALDVDEVVFAYSDVSHEEVMHRASRVLAAGADFRLLGPKCSTLRSRRPVVAVCAVRTGAGKSPVSRRVARILLDAGLRVILVRHPMAYRHLERQVAERYASLEDLAAAALTVEEREEYEPVVRMGVPVHAGVDYARVLEAAEAEADVIVWDGGNNDLPFVAPDLHITVVDPLRSGDELRYHPGEANLRLADAVVVSKLDAAEPGAVTSLLHHVRALNPTAPLVETTSPIHLEPGPSLAGARVLVIEDGPTLTHGGMAFGAGTVAARRAGADIVDPRPFAVGSIADLYAAWPHLGSALPAVGYSPAQLGDLGATVRAAHCDVVVVGTPADLAVLVDLGHPSRRVTYDLFEISHPTLSDLLAPHVEVWREREGRTVGTRG